MAIDVTKTAIYKRVAPCIRKEDRATFKKAMQMAAKNKRFSEDAACLCSMVVWSETPHGHAWWSLLAKSLDRSGNGYGWRTPDMLRNDQ